MSKASAITYALSFCVSTMLVHDALSQRSQGEDNLPTLYGARLDGSQIKIDVASFGCTDPSYFYVQLDPVATDVFSAVDHRAKARRVSNECSYHHIDFGHSGGCKSRRGQVSHGE